MSDKVRDALNRSATYWNTSGSTTWRINLKNGETKEGIVIAKGLGLYDLLGRTSCTFTPDHIKNMVPIVHGALNAGSDRQADSDDKEG